MVLVFLSIVLLWCVCVGAYLWMGVGACVCVGGGIVCGFLKSFSKFILKPTSMSVSNMLANTKFRLLSK